MGITYHGIQLILHPPDPPTTKAWTTKPKHHILTTPGSSYLVHYCGSLLTRCPPAYLNYLPTRSEKHKAKPNFFRFSLHSSRPRSRSESPLLSSFMGTQFFTLYPLGCLHLREGVGSRGRCWSWRRVIETDGGEREMEGAMIRGSSKRIEGEIYGQLHDL